MAQLKRRAYQNETYWGLPIRGFGDPAARIVIVGLAPAAHGANRTGRIFTGDRSGDWLYRALHKAGLANQPHAISRDDGLQLRDTYISCVVKCAPPDNKPDPSEISHCSSHLEAELSALRNARVFIALGGIALQGLWPFIAPSSPGGAKKSPRPKFSHGGEVTLGECPAIAPTAQSRTLLLSYHPSQQNTFTGRLTEPMFDRIFARAVDLVRS